MDLGDVAFLALAFFLIVAALVIAWLGTRAAAWLAAATDLLRNVDREALPAIAKVNTLLDQASGSLGKVDTILDSAVTGAQATEDVVRKTAGAVSKPLGAMAEAGAFVSGAASSFRTRRAERHADEP
jgi:hypothetical protein